jgi:hypothetical protein
MGTINVSSDSGDRFRVEDHEPLTAEELANIQSAEDDLRHGRMVPIEEYERQRGL